MNSPRRNAEHAAQLEAAEELRRQDARGRESEGRDRLAAEAVVHAKERLRLLSEASARLGATLDTGSRVAMLVRLAVPVLADAALVVIRGASAPLVAAGYHADPEKLRCVERMLDKFPPRREAPGLAQALATRRTELLASIGEEFERSIAESHEHLELLQGLGATAALSVPLVTAGETVGAIVLVLTSAGRAFDRDDVAFVEDLGRRASAAFDQVRMYDELVRANRLKDNFLATLSHELRTPLNAIVGWTHLLLDGTLEPDEVQKAIEVIHRNALSQTQLISDILDVSRITTGKLRLNVAPIDLAQVMRTAVDSLRPAAEAKTIRIEEIFARALPPVSGDEDRLRQVVWNLVSNAIKFTPKGGRVQIRLERPNSRVEIIVEDTGPGIAPDFLPHLFERFTQADGSTTRPHGGLGLGLGIVRHLVELHGGQVRAYNRADRSGAVFVVTLPLRSVERPTLVGQEQPSNLGMASAPDLTGIHVLVVDDQADARDLIATVLGQCGAVVTAVETAQEALRVLQAERPDVLLADVEMPEQDGYQLIQKVRQLPGDAGGLTPAAALTAFARTDDRYRALMAGFQIHVAKPVHPAELAAVVASLAGLRR